MDDLDAIRRIIEILEPFSNADRARIFRWVGERMGLQAGGDILASTTLDSDVLNPERAIREALAQGDTKRLKNLLGRLKDSGATRLVTAIGIALAHSGETEGRDFLFESLGRKDLDVEVRRAVLGALVQYYIVRDEEATGILELESRLRNEVEASSAPEEKAFFWNQLGRLYWGARRMKDAAEVQGLAARLEPGEPAYHYNLSVVLDKLGRLREAAMQARQAVALGTTDPDHLVQATLVLARAGLNPEAAELYKKLEALAPDRARVLAREESLVRKLATSESEATK